MKKLCLLLLTLCMFAPVIAEGEWDFYGSARIGAWYWNRSKRYERSDVWVDTEVDTVINNVDTTIIVQILHLDVFIEDSFPRQRALLDLQHNSHFGVKAKSDKFGFRFELGWGPVIKEIHIKILLDDATVNQRVRDGVLLRRLYGEWYINDYLTLLVGQEYAIANFFPSNQIFLEDAGLYYCGSLYTGRRPQVKLSCGSEASEMLSWKAEFAVVKPDTFIVECNYGDMEAEEKMPKMEGGAECSFNFGELFGFNLKGLLGINRYDLVRYGDEIGKTKNEIVEIKANCFAGSVDLNVWKTRLSFVYAYGKNLASYGVYMGDPWGWRADKNLLMFYPTWGKKDSLTDISELCNALTQQGALVFNIKPFEWFAWEIGAGMILNDHEDWDLKQDDELERVLNAFKRWAAYTNFQFSLVDKHILIVPEFSFSDFSGAAGQWYAAGLKMQFDM